MELLQRLTDHLDAIQSSLMGHMERVIDSQQEQEQRRLERVLTEGQQRNGQLQEHCPSSSPSPCPQPCAAVWRGPFARR